MEVISLSATDMGLVVVLVVGIVLGFERWVQRQREKKFNDAMSLIKSNGYVPHLYAADFNETDTQMGIALTLAASRGCVILDSSGGLVGRLLPPIEGMPQ